jgi:hypothetical protein
VIKILDNGIVVICAPLTFNALNAKLMTAQLKLALKLTIPVLS